jgi:hypothetical protein
MGMTLVGIESNCGCQYFIFRLRERCTYAQALEQVLGLLVDVEGARVAELGEVEGRDLGDVLVLALTLLFLKLEGDAADGTTLDALHQVRCVSGNLVPEALRRDDGNLETVNAGPVALLLRAHLIANPLVGLEVERQLGVVPLNDDLGGLLDGLSSNATHVGDCVWMYGCR